MSIKIYHPRKDIKGSGASFWFSESNQSVFATLLKQSGWDENSKNGVFKDSLNDPNMKINIKFSNVEIGGILDCIERNRPYTSFHDFDDKPKSISFVPFYTKTEPKTQAGFDFSVTVTDKQDSTNKNSFFIRFTYPEARLIREFLVFALHQQFRNYSDNFKNKTPKETSNIKEEPKKMASTQPVASTDDRALGSVLDSL